MNSYNNTKSVLIESENKNNCEQKSYGSINSDKNDSNITDDNNNKGWLSKATNGVYSMGAGAVSYGYGGLKWALSSTASAGSTVISAGTEGVVKLRKSVSKDKNE